MTMAEQEPVRTVTWEEPPDPQRRYDWSAIADELKSRPGEWAKVFNNDRASIVTALRQGAIRVLDPELGFESRTRNNVREPERRCSLYMRWVDPAPKKGKK